MAFVQATQWGFGIAKTCEEKPRLKAKNKSMILILEINRLSCYHEMSMPSTRIKITFLLTLFATYFWASPFAYSAEEQFQNASSSEYNHNVLVSPIGIMFAVWGLEYELRMFSNFHLGVGYSVFQDENATTENHYKQYKFVGTYLFNRPNHLTAWVQAGVGLNERLLTRKASNRETDITRFYSEVSGGYSWNWGPNIDARIGAGVAYAPVLTSNPVQPMLVWKIGYLF